MKGIFLALEQEREGFLAWRTGDEPLGSFLESSGWLGTQEVVAGVAAGVFLCLLVLLLLFAFLVPGGGWQASGVGTGASGDSRTGVGGLGVVGCPAFLPNHQVIFCLRAGSLLLALTCFLEYNFKLDVT